MICLSNELPAQNFGVFAIEFTGEFCLSINKYCGILCRKK